MTLNQIAASFANHLNQSSNHELLERIKDMVKEELAMWIRRSVKEHGIDDMLILSYYAEVGMFDAYGNPVEEIYKDYVIRTKYRVPTPVRINNDSPFIYVGSINGQVSYPKRSAYEATLNHLFLPTGGLYSYSISNNYITINDVPHRRFKADTIRIDAIFESPEQVLSMYEDVDGQDLELPIPLDIIPLMRDTIIERLGIIVPDTTEVTHDKPIPNVN
ncbi:hypothetical protein DSECCO2_120040 [anaerobic digester metagenome]